MVYLESSLSILDLFLPIELSSFFSSYILLIILASHGWKYVAIYSLWRQNPHTLYINFLYSSSYFHVLITSTDHDFLVRTTQVCIRWTFRIDDRMFIVDLICLPLFGLDIILGMDWLSANHVMLNFYDRSIVFPSTF